MFTVFGNQIFLRQKSGTDIEEIPAGTFGVGVTQSGEFFLYPKNDMEVPSVTYGDTDDKSERIIKTFLSRKGKNTGVLLEGTKGSGKTLQAKMLSSALREMGIPTISIGSAFNGEGFINFMSKITQPVMIMIDEFDKLYAEKDAQDGLLTLLDGVGGYDKLFVLTKNDGYVSEFLRNRPSRIFYSFSYKKLPKATMDDYLAKNLENKAFLPDFETLYNLSVDLNFDIVQSLVEELNRYPNDKFSDALALMGISITEHHYAAKEVKLLKVNGVDRTGDVSADTDINGMTAQGLFSGNRYVVAVDHKLGEEHLPEMEGVVTVEDKDEEGDYYWGVDRILLTYDEKHIRTMGGDGYHFVFTDDKGNNIEVVIKNKERKNYTEYVFGGRSY